MGAMVFTFYPVLGYAQYYYNNYNYNYNPLTVTTSNATSVTGKGAIFNGLVNGNNLYATYNLSTWFEYGTSTNFGYSTAQINSNSGYANFSAKVEGLSSNTVYYFRAIAQNPQGVIYGGINSFRTSLANVINTSAGNNSLSNFSVITNPATAIASRSAKLNSLITNPINDPSTTWFEWGIIPNLGNATPRISTGYLSSAKHINTITGLTPGTTYYFRAVVENSSLRVNGTTLSFTTSRGSTTQNAAGNNTNSSNVTNTSVLQPEGSALAANVLGSGSFFPASILGWLLLIILILVLILISKHLYAKFSYKEEKKAQEHR